MYMHQLHSNRLQIRYAALALGVLLLCVGLTASTAGTTHAGTPAENDGIQQATEIPTCVIGGAILPSPNTAPNPNTLSDVEVISANDVWAVGWYGGGYSSKTLTMHWDGAAWRVIPSPNFGESNSLFGVAAVSSSNVWAVGYYCTNTNAGPCGTLILHWDGTQWARVPSPAGGILYEIDVVSANDIWAVGGGSTSLTLHWDGTEWTRVPSPNFYAGYGGVEQNVLYDVEVISADNVLAVGYAGMYEKFTQGYDVMAMRWNGTEWNATLGPNPTPYNDKFLTAVSAVSASDIWAVGYSTTSSGTYPLIKHWNGSSWQSVTAPCTNCSLADVAAISSTNVWAVGSSGGQAVAIRWDGATWSMVSTVPIGPLDAVSALSATNIWAVGSTPEQNTQTANWNGSQWSTISSPNVKSGYNTLRDVEVIASNDIWAVGYSAPLSSDSSATYGAKTMVQHWDGTAWSVVPSPNLPTQGDSSYLYALSAVSADDIWAVGNYRGFELGRLVAKPLSLHWDGTQWNAIPVPSTEGCSYPLTSVKAISTYDVWATARIYCNDPTSGSAIFFHWNGQQWTQDTSLQWNPHNNSTLLGIDGAASNDLWAVGEYRTSPGGAYRTLIVHWDGTQWSLVTSPNVGPDNNRLKGVKAIAPDDVWAVGYSGPPGEGHALVLHWNGTAWSVVPTPIAGESSYLFGIEAASANEIWAVGNYYSGGLAKTLVERWDGGQWRVVTSPNASDGRNYLYGVATTSAGDIWAVGDYTFESGQQTLVMRLAPTFSDVPPDNTFFPYVRCLVNRGVASGYEDCTFRPNANVTRGQLSKIVANSAGFNEPVSGVMFEDVPTTNTFYAFVQRMASRGIIGGYPCGGAGEPCGAGDKPYFRPNANATRGQISKIVSQARGYADPVSGQTFEDVLPSDSFYLYIERLAGRGIMGGYPCGAAGEPCVSGKPYFRPNNNATRGQVSKIVSNAFFPNCESGNKP